MVEIETNFDLLIDAEKSDCIEIWINKLQIGYVYKDENVWYSDFCGLYADYEVLPFCAKEKAIKCIEEKYIEWHKQTTQILGLKES